MDDPNTNVAQNATKTLNDNGCSKCWRQKYVDLIFISQLLS